MSAYYPAFLDLRGKLVVVVGGGLVAQRKVEQLLASGARVTVVSPEATGEVAQMQAAGQITWLRREYTTGDLTGAVLAIAATDDVQVNRTVAIAARADRIMVNAVDDVEYCDFIAPAVVEQGDITLAISTGGKSPAMARYLRRTLAEFLAPEYATLLGVAEEVRRRLRSEGRSAAPDRWQDAIDPGVISLARSGMPEAAQQRLYGNLTDAFPWRWCRACTLRAAAAQVAAAGVVR